MSVFCPEDALGSASGEFERCVVHIRSVTESILREQREQMLRLSHAVDRFVGVQSLVMRGPPCQDVTPGVMTCEQLPAALFDGDFLEAVGRDVSALCAGINVELGCESHEVSETCELEVWEPEERERVLPQQLRSGRRTNTMLDMRLSRAKTSARPSRVSLQSEDPKEVTRVAYQQALTMIESPSPGLMRWSSVFLETREKYLKASGRRFPHVDAFVQSKFFMGLSAALIFANALFIAIATDDEAKVAIARHYTGSRIVDDAATLSGEAIFSANVFFSVVFSLDLCLRIVVLRCHFWLGPDWRWNMLDVAAVAASLTELIAASGRLNTGFIKLLRLIRMIRTVQVIRAYPAFRELRLMMVAIVDSMLSLCLVMTLLIFFMFFFAIILLQGVTEHLVDADALAADTLVRYFHSMNMTVLTLGMCISGGINWGIIEEVFLEISTPYALVLVLYQALMILAMLNIVTGIFVHSAVGAAQNDRSLRVMTEIQHTSELVKNLHDLFDEIDKNVDSCITLEEFKGQMDKAEFRAFLSALGMNTTDALRLFSALDVDENCMVEIDEFVAGCLTLQKPNASVDMETIKRQNRRILEKLNNLADMQVLCIDQENCESCCS